MRLKVHHTTRYAYDSLPSHVVQRLYLEPADFATQKCLRWNISCPGIENALRYKDGAGNWVHLVTSQPTAAELTITAEGEVDVQESAGVMRGLDATTPPTVYLRQTPATLPDKRLSDFAKSLQSASPVLDRAHALMRAVHEKVAYEVGTSHAHTTAAEAFADQQGVCQDHAHIMITLARLLEMPARYVTGYLVTGQGASSTAAHAWAELFIPDLGWVGFDAANGQCPTDHYVRVAAGLDAAAVAPIRGSRRGAQGAEHLRVEVRVEISQQ